MKNIYLIVGASGTGKSTMVERLVKYYNAKEVLSYTDREPRYEGEGTHIFVTPEEFDKLPQLVAFTNFSGHRYGVPAHMIDESDFYVIDPAGVLYLYKHYKGQRPIKVIGITARDEVVRKRLLQRDDSDSRIEHDKNIFTDSVMKLVCDKIVDGSGSVSETISQAVNIIDKYEEE